MTLREKFRSALPFNNYRDSVKLEKIADTFSIGFKDWCDNEGRFVIGISTTKELLKTYKKEKGL